MIQWTRWTAAWHVARYLDFCPCDLCQVVRRRLGLSEPKATAP